MTIHESHLWKSMRSALGMDPHLYAYRLRLEGWSYTAIAEIMAEDSGGLSVTAPTVGSWCGLGRWAAEALGEDVPEPEQLAFTGKRLP